MLCQFEKLLYPRTADATTIDYMIAVYRPLETIRDSAGDMLSEVKAVGYCLPIAEKVRYRLNGHWAKHPRHGLQFEVEGYEEVISHTRELLFDEHFVITRCITERKLANGYGKIQRTVTKKNAKSCLLLQKVA